MLTHPAVEGIAEVSLRLALRPDAGGPGMELFALPLPFAWRFGVALPAKKRAARGRPKDWLEYQVMKNLMLQKHMERRKLQERPSNSVNFAKHGESGRLTGWSALPRNQGRNAAFMVGMARVSFWRACLGAGDRPPRLFDCPRTSRAPGP